MLPTLKIFYFLPLVKGHVVPRGANVSEVKLKHEAEWFRRAMLLGGASPRRRLLRNSRGSDEAFKNKDALPPPQPCLKVDLQRNSAVSLPSPA